MNGWIDFLWLVVMVAAALKVGSTIILLCCDRRFRDQPGLGSALWWTTKITPPFMLAGLYGFAWQPQDRALAIFAAVLTVWVAVAVPRMIRLRNRRIARG